MGERQLVTTPAGNASQKMRSGDERGRGRTPGIVLQEDGWSKRRQSKQNRLVAAQPWMKGRILSPDRIIPALDALIQPGDRVVIEGDNQKQADFLSRSLVQADPKKLHDLHVIISSISRPEHLTIFELGIAKKIDFAFSSQSLRLSQLIEDGALEVGAVRTLESFGSRLYVEGWIKLNANVSGGLCLLTAVKTQWRS